MNADKRAPWKSDSIGMRHQMLVVAITKINDDLLQLSKMTIESYMELEGTIVRDRAEKNLDKRRNDAQVVTGYLAEALDVLKNDPENLRTVKHLLQVAEMIRPFTHEGIHELVRIAGLFDPEAF